MRSENKRVQHNLSNNAACRGKSRSLVSGHPLTPPASSNNAARRGESARVLGEDVLYDAGLIVQLGVEIVLQVDAPSADIVRLREVDGSAAGLARIEREGDAG